MSPNELREFRARCLKSSVNGHRVANASAYVAMLEEEGGKIALRRGMVKHSAAHLVALADNVAKVRAEGGKKKKTPAKPKAPAAKPKAVEEAKTEPPAPLPIVEEPPAVDVGVDETAEEAPVVAKRGRKKKED